MRQVVVEEIPSYREQTHDQNEYRNLKVKFFVPGDYAAIVNKKSTEFLAGEHSLLLLWGVPVPDDIRHI